MKGTYTYYTIPKVSSGYRCQPMLVGNLQVVGSILRPVDFGSGNGRGVVHVKIVAKVVVAAYGFGLGASLPQLHAL